MRKGLLIILTCLTCALHATVYTPAIVPDPKQDGQNCYVSNPDAIVSDSDVMALNKICSELKQQTDVEMAIVCVDSISESYTMFDFGFEIFQTWASALRTRIRVFSLLYVNPDAASFSIPVPVSKAS